MKINGQINPWGISIFEKKEYLEKSWSKVKNSSGNKFVAKNKSVIFLFSEIVCLSRKIEQKQGQN